MEDKQAAPSGAKYDRTIRSKYDPSETMVVDVYDVLKAFGVTSQPTGHAIKKLLCAGLRGKGDMMQDLIEAVDAIQRAVELSPVPDETVVEDHPRLQAKPRSPLRFPDGRGADVEKAKFSEGEGIKKAYAEGTLAGESGFPQISNPYPPSDHARWHAWTTGWLLIHHQKQDEANDTNTQGH